MAAGDEPPIFGTAVQAWRDALLAMRRMPLVTGIAILIVTAPRIFAELVPEFKVPTLEQAYLLIVLSFLGLVQFTAVQSALVAPAAIAAHRFVVLGEAAPRYSFLLSKRRWIFVFFFLGVVALISGPAIVILLWAFIVDVASWRILAIAALLFYAAFVLVFVRALILFPAIAVGAPGASWRNAIADCEGHTWRVVAILCVTVIPIMGIQIAISEIHDYFVEVQISHDPHITAIERTIDILDDLAIALVRVFALFAFAAVASRLFMALANKLKAERPESR
jgi:hypothetical protein